MANNTLQSFFLPVRLGSSENARMLKLTVRIETNLLIEVEDEEDLFFYKALEITKDDFDANYKSQFNKSIEFIEYGLYIIEFLEKVSRPESNFFATLTPDSLLEDIFMINENSILSVLTHIKLRLQNAPLIVIKDRVLRQFNSVKENNTDLSKKNITLEQVLEHFVKLNHEMKTVSKQLMLASKEEMEKRDKKFIRDIETRTSYYKEKIDVLNAQHQKEINDLQERCKFLDNKCDDQLLLEMQHHKTECVFKEKEKQRLIDQIREAHKQFHESIKRQKEDSERAELLSKVNDLTAALHREKTRSDEERNKVISLSNQLKQEKFRCADLQNEKTDMFFSCEKMKFKISSLLKKLDEIDSIVKVREGKTRTFFHEIHEKNKTIRDLHTKNILLTQELNEIKSELTRFSDTGRTQRPADVNVSYNQPIGETNAPDPSMVPHPSSQENTNLDVSNYLRKKFQ